MICDQNERVLVLFLAQDDPAYDRAVSTAHEEMIKARRSLNKVPSDAHRGTEPLNTGWYMGTGTTNVVWKRAKDHPGLADQLRDSEAVKRVVGVGTSKCLLVSDNNVNGSLHRTLEILVSGRPRTSTSTNGRCRTFDR